MRILRTILKAIKTVLRKIGNLNKCEACAAKDQHIADLRKLSIPQQVNQIPLINLEGDAILSGRDEVMPVKMELTPEEQDVLAEASQILAGTY